jgi:hypothetical protein
MPTGFRFAMASVMDDTKAKTVDAKYVPTYPIADCKVGSYSLLLVLRTVG